ncbi:MAG: RHS repeat-associated core domain-containing protein [Nitrospira sp.]|nr:RHS repeat-associated core domain-containing protein [Nitrospira sp.]
MLTHPSREADSPGLYHYRARYYQPKLQRFISEDPIGFLGGDANLYAYVFGNPLRFRDPSGLLGSTGPIDVFSPSSGTVTVNANLAQFLTPNSTASNAPMTSADSRALAGTAAGIAAIAAGVTLIGTAAIPATATGTILTAISTAGEFDLILHGLAAAGVTASAALVNGMLGVMAVDAGLNMIPIVGCKKCKQ